MGVDGPHISGVVASFQSRELMSRLFLKLREKKKLMGECVLLYNVVNI